MLAYQYGKCLLSRKFQMLCRSVWQFREAEMHSRKEPLAREEFLPAGDDAQNEKGGGKRGY
jgi:hypothetical protein